MLWIKLLKVYNRNIFRSLSIFIVILIFVLLVLTPNIVSALLSSEFYSTVIEKIDTHYMVTGTVSIENVELLKRFVYEYDRPHRNIWLILEARVDAVVGSRELNGFRLYTGYPNHLDAVSFIAQSIYGRGNISRGEIIVGSSVAVNVSSVLSVAVSGDRDVKYFNFTVTGLYDPKPIMYVRLGPFGYESGVTSFGAPQGYIHPSDFEELISSIDAKFLYYRVVVMYEKDFFRGLDLGKIIERLNQSNMEVKKSVSALADVRDEYDNLSSQLAIYTFTRTFINVGIYTNAIPFFIGVWYFLSINIDLLIGDYRREIAILRARGIPSRRLFNSLIIYLMLLTILASIVGSLSAPLWIPIILSSIGVEAAYDIESLIDPVTSLGVAITTIIIVFFTLYRKRKIFRDILPSDAIHRYEYGVEAIHESRIGRFTIIMFILGTIKLVEWLLNINVFKYMNRVDNLYIFIILAIYGMISGFLNIFAPIFFIYSSIEILTHSRKVVRFLSRVSSWLVRGGLRDILANYVYRSPRWMSRAAFISSLMIALMIFSLIYSARTVSFYNDYTMIINTPDIIIPLPKGVYSSFDEYKSGLATYLEDVEGVGGWGVGYEIFIEYFIYDGKNRTDIPGRILVFSSVDDFSNVVYLGGSWNYYGPVDIRDALSSGIILSDRFLGYLENLLGYRLGDPIKLGISYGLPYQGAFPPVPERPELGQVIDTRVEGVLYVAPKRYDGYTTLEAIGPINISLYNVQPVLYIDVAEGYDAADVRRQLSSIGLSSVPTIEETPDIFVGLGREFQIISSYSYHIYMVLGIVAALASIFILSIQHVKSMLRDVVILRARGFGARDIFSFMYSSSLYIVIFSIVLGILVGYLSGMGVSQMNIDGLVGGRLDYPLNIGLTGLLDVLVVVLLYLATPLPAIIRYINVNVSEGLRRVEH